MPVQAVEQGECESCGESEENYTFEERSMSVTDNTVSHVLRCECGEQAIVQIDEEGLSYVENVSHEDASWNQDSS